VKREEIEEIRERREKREERRERGGLWTVGQLKRRVGVASMVGPAINWPLRSWEKVRGEIDQCEHHDLTYGNFTDDH
jgi:hypothetical protein